MSSKIYVVCAFDHGQDAQRFFTSFSESFGDNVIPISLQYQNGDTHFPLKLPTGAIGVTTNKPYSGNTARHLDLFKVVQKLEEITDPRAWVFFTDVHDVIFQAPFPELPEDADILIAPEGKRFGEIDFWKVRSPKEMHHLDMYNAGSFAMRYEVLMKYWAQLQAEWDDFYHWYKIGEIDYIMDTPMYPFGTPVIDQRVKFSIGQIFNGFFDTIFFNRFLFEHRNEYHASVVPNLFGVYAFNYELGNLVQEKNGKTYSKDGEIISIVHFNGSMKTFLPKTGGQHDDDGKN